MAETQAMPQELKLWQRFHVRLSTLYGGLVFAVLLSIAGFFYSRGVESERTALQARLRIAAAALATSITAEDLATIRTPSDTNTPAFRRIATHFKAVADAEPDFSDLYIMRPGSKPDSLEIVVDVVIRADAPSGKPGDPYEPVQGTRILEGLKRPTVEEEPYRDAWGTVLSGYAPIRTADGRTVALVGLDVRASRLEDIRRQVAVVVMAVISISVAALVALALVVARMVQQPLARMVEATNAIAAGRLEVRLRLQRGDEFGLVSRHFDNMASGLEEREFIKNTFGQYVAPEVVQRMITDRSEAIRGQRRHVAVMFVDLRGFTRLSEGMAPEEVVLLLNQYLDRMTRVITEHGGRIDKFIGDAILADWGTLDCGTVPEMAAAQAAMAMVDAMAAWNKERHLQGKVPLEIGIALHAGPVVAGSIGSEHKLEYTIIGDTVNVASRLEGLCKVYGSRLVASGPLVQASGCYERARWLETLVLRGRSEATEVFELLTDADPRLSQLTAYSRAIELLRAGDRDGARNALEALLQQGSDPVVAHQLQALQRHSLTGA